LPDYFPIFTYLLYMRRTPLILFFILSVLFIQAQMTPCQNNLVYWDLSPIRIYDPALPYSGTNPVNAVEPNGPGGLSYGPNFTGGFPSPTYYTVIAGQYNYWNGSVWVSTGHAATASAVNHGSGAGCLYNLIGGTGQIYKYIGTGPDILLVTVAGWGGGGPYDIVVDNCCNFYLLRTLSPQALWCFDPNGVLTSSCTLSNLPSSSAGGGFAIVGNTVVVGNGGGLWLGAVTGSNVNFTNVTTTMTIYNDFASCPINCGGPCAVQLPITFGNFNGENISAGNLLTWETEMEENISHFYVERSADAVNFESIAKVNAKGNANKYEFTDTEPIKNVLNYYRITGVEKNLNSRSTYVIHLGSAPGKMSASAVFPNPVTNELTLMLASDENGFASMQVYNSFGELVRSEAKHTYAGVSRFQLTMKELPAGIYIVTLMNSLGELVTTQRVTKVD
jgi:hypothetical protein